ncbi:uncharacterized protein [Phyllobates terribilis]|uniref:uncharacterized protein n=1 Tax=Phyllobates terribilis TaxID=111132 RepID=UPI003CCB4E14
MDEIGFSFFGGKPDYINECIPKAFLKHLSLSESEDFVAVLKNNKCADKSWLVKVDSDGRRFLDGWKEFAQDNCLSVGDFVVFRYLGGFAFDVLVCDSLTGCEQSFSADHRTILSESNHSEINDLNGEKTHPSETSNRSPSHSEGRVLSNETSNLHVEKKAEFKPSKYPYFRSSVKQYSFTWHATLIPTDFARENNLAKRWCEMTIIDQKNRSWPINLRYRKNGKDQVYLASGWDKLRDAHELKVGDSMVFELIDSGSHPLMKFYRFS